MQSARFMTRAQDTTDDPKTAASALAVGTAGIVLKAAPGRLYGLNAINTSGAIVYLMIFDATAAPSAAANPKYQVAIPATGAVSLDQAIALYGLGCKNGITIAFSTTPSALTYATAVCHYSALYM